MALSRTSMRRRPADDHLSGDEWRLFGHLLATRSGPRCECCGGDLRGVPRDRLEIQHRQARGMGGTSLVSANDLANLLLFHSACHRWVESRPTVTYVDADGEERTVGAAEIRGLWVPHQYDNGQPVPVETVPVILASGRRVYLDPVSAPYIERPDRWTYTGPLVVPGR